MMRARSTTSVAGLTAGAVWIFSGISVMVKQYLPEHYRRVYEWVDIPLVLIGTFAIVAYGRRQAIRQGEEFPL